MKRQSERILALLLCLLLAFALVPSAAAENGTIPEEAVVAELPDEGSQVISADPDPVQPEKPSAVEVPIEIPIEESQPEEPQPEEPLPEEPQIEHPQAEEPRTEGPGEIPVAPPQESPAPEQPAEGLTPTPTPEAPVLVPEVSDGVNRVYGSFREGTALSVVAYQPFQRAKRRLMKSAVAPAAASAVQESLADRILVALDIKLTEENAQIQPEGNVEVRVPGISGLRDGSVQIIHILDSMEAISRAGNLQILTDPAIVYPAYEATDSFAAARSAAAALGYGGTLCAETLGGTVVGGELRFVTSSFSIFLIKNQESDPVVVTPRHTYEFVGENGEGEYPFYNQAGALVTQQIIKNGESLVDIGAPYKEDAIFLGWYEYANGAYGNPIAFDTPISVTEERTIYVAPKFQATSCVTFHQFEYGGEEEDVIHTKAVVAVSGEAVPGVLVSDVTAPDKSSTTRFYGWQTQDGGIQLYVRDLETGAVIPDVMLAGITGDVDLYPIFRESFWLSFDTQSTTSVLPARLFLSETGPDTLSDAIPTKKGYDFAGWYEGETQVSLGDGTLTAVLVLTADKMLTAHWTPKSDAIFTVVIWQQSVNDDKNAAPEERTYDYKESHVVTGATTGEVPVVPQEYITIHYSGFTYARNDAAEKAVDPEGSTVVNVYYDRNLMTINFVGQVANWAYTTQPSTDGSVRYYRREGNNYFPLYYYAKEACWIYEYNGRYYYYTDNIFYYVSWSPQGTPASYTGLYEQTLTQNGIPWDGTVKWWNHSNGNTSLPYMERLQFSSDTSIWELRFNENNDPIEYTLYAKDLSARGNYYHYLESLDGTYNYLSPIASYPLGSEIGKTSLGSLFKGFQIDSYHLGDNVGPNVSWNASNFSDISLSGINNVHVRHSRRSYDLVYRSEGEIVRTESIKYEAPLNSYHYTQAQIGLPDRMGYVFTGWYMDDTCTVPFNFNQTMPYHNLVVYAGWEPIVYTVTYDPAGGVMPNGDDGLPITSMEVVFGSGDKAVDYTPTQTDTEDISYIFLGWYDAATNEPYAFQNTVTSDVHLIARWLEEGNYAIAYSPTSQVGETTVTAATCPADDEQYADAARFIVEAPVSGITPEGYVFDGWQITVSGGVDADVIDETLYQPGDLLTLNAQAWARGSVVHFRAHYVKTEDASDAPVIHLIFDANGGTVTDLTDGAEVAGTQNPATLVVTETMVQVRNLLPNEGFTTYTGENFTKDGYELAGWSTIQMAEPVSEFTSDGITTFPCGAVVGADAAPDAANILYAVWKNAKTTLTITKAAAVEDANQTFVFTVTTGTGESLGTFSARAGQPIVLKDLLIGTTCTVTEVSSWSWRYSDGGSKSITLQDGGNSISFQNTVTTSKWLSGEAVCTNTASAAN